MKRAIRGCGCAIAVLFVVLGASAFVFWKWGLPWWRSRPPKPVGELQRHRPGARRPQAKSDPFGIQLGSERKLMMPAHDHPCLVTETVLEP